MVLRLYTRAPEQRCHTHACCVFDKVIAKTQRTHEVLGVDFEQNLRSRVATSCVTFVRLGQTELATKARRTQT